MIEEGRVIDAFKTSTITCVALLDDAFDPPSVPEEHMGAVLDLLANLEAGELAPGVSITSGEIDAAVNALSASEYKSDELCIALSKLFRAYVTTDLDKFDPGGSFKVQKGNNLAYVRPILLLLRKCDPKLEIILCGSQESDMDDAAKRAQLIFVDFFLNANLSTDGDPNEEQKESARNASLIRLRQLVDAHELNPDNMPSVILMSSHEVEHRIESFRIDLSKDRGDIFSSRFDFLQKKSLTTNHSGHILIEAREFEVLIGILQSFSFGRAIFRALQQWKNGVDTAVNELWLEVNALKIKDFAYLTRFRLAQEGMALSEYLEWFFSECLNDAISRAVDWSHESFANIDQDGGPATKVRGAFDGPTDQIAKMFDRVRVEKPRPIARRSHRFGDLFIDKEWKKVRAILTPDCDLLIRKSGNAKAVRLLTVGGTLMDINAEGAPLADFLLIDESPRCVSWNLKDVRTHDFKWWPRPGANGNVWKFFGTLRPLYAYELRARVLDDLSRFGLNVPPALGTNIAAKAIVNGSKEDFEIALALPGKAACSLVLSRGGLDSNRIIFYESVAIYLINELKKIDANSLQEGDIRKFLLDVQNKPLTQDKIIEKLTTEGLSINKDSVSGIKILDKKIDRNKKERPWCQIVISA